MRTQARPEGDPHVDVLARTYDVALLDLDGVVYIGADPVTHAPQALDAARTEGMRLAFVTNNASRTPDVVSAHLTELGIQACAEEVITSAQATARLLAERLEAGSRVLVVGGEGLFMALQEKQLVPVWSATDHPAAVAQGFAPELGWRALAEGTYAVASGVPWIASNIDRTIPTARGAAPGNGVLVDAITAATGRRPEVAGKPEPPMHREAMLRTAAMRPLVIGDRLDTDIEGAARAGTDSLLVLTGVTAAADVVLAAPHARPTYIGEDLRALLEPPSALSVTAGQRRHGGWEATVHDDRLVLRRADHQPARNGTVDAIRAACGAVWEHGEGLDPKQVRATLHEVLTPHEPGPVASETATACRAPTR